MSPPAFIVASTLGYVSVMLLLNVISDWGFPACYDPAKCFDYDYELGSSLQKSRDPCDDLFEHVCAHFRFRHPLAITWFSLQDFRSKVTLHRVLGQRRTSSQSVFDKIALGYQSCIRVITNEEHNVLTIRSLFATYNFDWPSLSQPKNFDFLDVSVGLPLDYYLPILFGLEVMPYFPTNQKYALTFTIGQVFLNPGFRILEGGALAYCIQTFASVSREKAAVMAKKMSTVTHDLESMLVAYGDRVESNFTKLSDIQKFSAVTSSRWIDVLNRHLPWTHHVTANDDVFVFISSPFLLKQVIQQYKKKMADLFLYLGFNLIVALAPAFSYPVTSCQFSLWMPKYGSAHTDLCLSSMIQLAPFAVARAMFDEILDFAAVNATTDMFRNIREATKKSFQSVSWMATKSTRDTAAARLDALKELEGLPRHLFTHRDLEDFYSYLPSFDRSFIIDFLESRNRWMNKTKSWLKPNASTRPPSRVEVPMNLIDVNAFYAPLFHMMIIPGSIMQPPFLDTKMPVSALYGSLGRILGHELTHSYDSVFGNILPTGVVQDWYDPQSRASFTNKLKCLIKQINSRTGVPTFGNNSLSENFADNAGMEKAILAFNALRDKGSSTLGYTQDQLFFISGCFVFCAMSKTYDFSSEQYPTFGLRCNLAAGNSEMYSRAFSCPKDAKMNFRQRCTFHN